MKKTNKFILAAALSCLTTVGTAQITLPYVQDFEGATAATTQSNVASIPGATEWEYTTSTGQGRMRTAAGAGYYNSGSRAITLDASPNGANPDPVNYLIGHLNLSNYSVANHLIVLEYAWMDHGDEADINDRVWVRGSNTDAWIEIHNWQAANPPIGQYQNFSNFDLTAALVGAGQDFSATTEIRFGQQDNFQSTSPTASDGLTIDDVALYNIVPNNVGVIAILDPTGMPCGDSATIVNVVVENFGSNKVAAVGVTVNRTGALQSTAMGTSGINDSIAFGEIDTIAISSFNTYAGGLVDITTFTTLANDTIPVNDTTIASVTFRGLETAVANPVSVCAAGDNATLYAQNIPGYQNVWYDSLTGGNVLTMGDTLLTGPITNSITYYVAALDIAPSSSVGHAGPGTITVNPSSYFENFTAINAFTLDSMTVYPTDTGYVVIRLRDATGINIVGYKSVLVQPANALDSVRIPVGFMVQPGSYIIDAVGSTVPGLGFTNTNISYPYTLVDVVEITSNNIGTSNVFNFFDWEVTPESCAGSRVAVPVTIEICAGVDENQNDLISNVYPNPTNGILNVDLGTHSGVINYSISTIEGRVVRQEQNVSSNKMIIDLSGESNGIYLLQISDDNTSKVYKVIKE